MTWRREKVLLFLELIAPVFIGPKPYLAPKGDESELEHTRHLFHHALHLLEHVEQAIHLLNMQARPGHL